MQAIAQYTCNIAQKYPANFMQNGEMQIKQQKGVEKIRRIVYI